MNDRIMTGTGLKVSRFSLGTMMFGGQTNEEDSIEMIRFAIEHGVTSIDTADLYNTGVTETIVGKALKGIREQIVLATKFGGKMGQGPNDGGFSRLHVVKACDDSLRRLNTDYIDVYYLHWPDYTCPMEETLEATTQLVKSGKVRYIAVSNFASWQVTKAQWISEKNHFVAPICNQVVYNLLQRDIERELVPCLKDAVVGLAIYNPLAGGLLTGKHQRGMPQGVNRFNTNQGSGAKTLGEVYFDRYWTEENFVAVDEYTAIAKNEGISLVELAIRWCISQHHVDTILIGASKKEQLQQNVVALDKPDLSEATLTACDQVYQKLTGNRFKYNR